MNQEKKLKVDVEGALSEDKAFNEGASEYQRLSEQAQTISEEMTSTLIESVVKSSESKDNYRFTLTSAILATAKTLTNLTAYAYDDHELFIHDIKKARELVVSRIIPALLNPMPCGLCINCKNHKEEECINPVMETENTHTRFLPMISNFLIEYDVWSKILYMYTEGKVDLSKDNEDETSENKNSVDKAVDNVDNK